jgi:hypothetical protein
MQERGGIGGCRGRGEYKECTNHHIHTLEVEFMSCQPLELEKEEKFNIRTIM